MPGAQVRVIARTGGGTLASTSIRLGAQGIQGVVSGYTPSSSQATFTLNVPADSAFAKLTGATSITVYQRAGTQLRGASSDRKPLNHALWHLRITLQEAKREAKSGA